jgi:hypothetical protein
MTFAVLMAETAGLSPASGAPDMECGNSLVCGASPASFVAACGVAALVATACCKPDDAAVEMEADASTGFAVTVAAALASPCVCWPDGAGAGTCVVAELAVLEDFAVPAIAPLEDAPSETAAVEVPVVFGAEDWVDEIGFPIGPEAISGAGMVIAAARVTAVAALCATTNPAALAEEPDVLFGADALFTVSAASEVCASADAALAASAGRASESWMCCAEIGADGTDAEVTRGSTAAAARVAL